MKHAYHKWYSAALGRDMELQVMGHAGARVLVFPTSLGSYSEWTDRRMDRAGVLGDRSEEHTSELQSHSDLVCRLLLEKKKVREHTR